MKFALGIVYLNEARWLRLHLPVMLRADSITGVVAVGGGSTDGSGEVICAACADAGKTWDITERKWGWHFANQQNAVIERAEALGYDAMLKYDPDELMFPAAIDTAAQLLFGGAKAIAFPRINFEQDRLHYAPFQNHRDLSDYQTRAHVLGENFRWQGRLHASVNAWSLWSESQDSALGAQRKIMRLPHTPIFHYEGLKPMRERQLKWANYERVQRGEAPLAELPAGIPTRSQPAQFIVPYQGAQPLDPFECGITAPYPEERA